MWPVSAKKSKMGSFRLTSLDSKMLFAVYKPKGPSSNKVLSYIRFLTQEKHVGHAGTLDPLAEGVLVVGIGREATRKLADTVRKEKEYVAEIMLGETSATDDAEGSRRPHAVKKVPTREDVEAAAQRFVGKVMQVPPIFSALKIKGKPAYKLARSGLKPRMRAREVEIREIEILEYAWPLLRLRVVTGPGVYIRALARDIGSKLRVGGYLAGLVRTRVGDFTLSTAVRVEDLQSGIKPRMTDPAI